MNRRAFLRSAALGAAGAALPLPGRAQTAKLPRKPNLLFIWTDQQRFDTLACYGNPRLHTPNLDRLASQSVRFDQAYVAHPVCTPSRSCMMTGLWPHQTGCTANNRALPAAARCLPELLGDSDYRTGYVGKWHLGDEVFAQHGWEEWHATEDMYERGFSPDRDRSAKSAYWHYLHDQGYRPDKPPYYSREMACKVPIDDGKPAFQARIAKDFLSRHRASPFVLHVSYLEPHTPYTSPLHGLYDPREMTLDDSLLHDDEADAPYRYRMRRAYFKGVKALAADDSRKAVKTQYWGNISVVDRSVGQILSHLESLGLEERTIVVFTSDHGDQMSAHGMWFKEVLYQEALRVPYLLRVPGARGGAAVKDPVSHVDLIPTMLDLMGAKVPEHLPGESLAPVVRDEPAAPKNRTVFAQWSPNPEGENMYATRPEWSRYVRESSRMALSPDGWKLVLSDVDKGQLYNLRDDPHEEHNQFYRGNQGKVIARLTGEIHAWQERTADPLRV